MRGQADSEGSGEGRGHLKAPPPGRARPPRRQARLQGRLAYVEAEHDRTQRTLQAAVSLLASKLEQVEARQQEGESVQQTLRQELVALRQRLIRFGIDPANLVIVDDRCCGSQVGPLLLPTPTRLPMLELEPEQQLEHLERHTSSPR